MITRNITLPEIGLVAGTRAALGAGVALLVADHLTPEQRRSIGWTLVAVGVLSTFPLAANFLQQSRAGSNGRAEKSPAGNRATSLESP